MPAGRTPSGIPEPQLQSPVPPISLISSTHGNKGVGSPRMGIKVGNVRVSLSGKGGVLEDGRSPRSSANPGSARSGGFLSMLTPRATPREPELKTTHCFLILNDFYDGQPSSVTYQHGMSTIGLQLEGATVDAVDDFGPMNDYSKYSFKKGDVIKKIGGRDFEFAKPLHEYLVPGRRAIKCEVERWVTPPRYPLNARVVGMLEMSGAEMPDEAEEMESIIQDFELMKENPHLMAGSLGMTHGISAMGMGMGGVGGFGMMGGIQLHR